MEKSLLKLKRFFSAIIDILIYLLIYLLFIVLEGYILEKNPEIFNLSNLVINLLFALSILFRDYISPGKLILKLKVTNRNFKNSTIRNFIFSIPFFLSSLTPYMNKSKLTSTTEFIFVTLPIIYALMELTLIFIGSGSRFIDKFTNSEIIDNSTKT